MIGKIAIRGIRGRAPKSPTGFVIGSNPKTGNIELQPRAAFVDAAGATAAVANSGIVPTPDGTTIVSSANNVWSALAQVNIYAPCVVSALPAGAQGDRGFVTDATTTLALGLGLAPIGGGGNETPVYRDSVGWKIG